MRRVHGVRVGTSWGTLSMELQRTWTQLDCDRGDPTLQQAREQETRDLANYAVNMAAALRARSAERRLSRHEAQDTVVAVCVSTTSRNTKAR